MVLLLLALLHLLVLILLGYTFKWLFRMLEKAGWLSAMNSPAKRGAVFHDLLSSGLTGESINDLALEVKPIHLAWWRTRRAEALSLYAQGAYSRVSVHLARADGGDAQTGRSGITLHCHHHRSTLGQISRQLDRSEAAGN